MNESPLDRLIRELRAENDKLKRQLDGGTLVMATGIDAKGGILDYKCRFVGL